jgi:hypothetical protein
VVADVSKGDADARPRKAGISPFISLDLPSAIADYLEHRGCHMRLDDPFPLEIVPSPAKHAMLGVFKGRWPSVREVAQVPDSYWLATPAIGRKLLQTIRAVTDAPRSEADVLALPRLSDAELLDRLESLREELRYIHATLKAKTRKAARNKDRFQGHSSRSSRSGNDPSGGARPQRGPEGLAL